jgi:hypothetical protein
MLCLLEAVAPNDGAVAKNAKAKAITGLAFPYSVLRSLCDR